MVHRLPVVTSCLSQTIYVSLSRCCEQFINSLMWMVPQGDEEAVPEGTEWLKLKLPAKLDAKDQDDLQLHFDISAQNPAEVSLICQVDD